MVICSSDADTLTTTPRQEEEPCRAHEPRTATAAAGAAEEVTFVTTKPLERKRPSEISQKIVTSSGKTARPDTGCQDLAVAGVF